MVAQAIDFDPYELLELQDTCTEQEVVKAYRKKALQWHPDKNADRKEYAQEMFLKISRALEVLADGAARAALDRLRQARKAAEERYKHMDAKRRKLKEELEAREARSQTHQEDEREAARRLAAEIQRLRTEGSKLLQRERENIEKQVKEENADRPTASKTSNNLLIKVRWDETIDDVSEELIRSTFSKFGDIVEVVVALKKRIALIEFCQAESMMAAERAFQNADTPFQVEVLGRKEEERKAKPTSMQEACPTQDEHTKFEASILARMHQAEREKNLQKPGSNL